MCGRKRETGGSTRSDIAQNFYEKLTSNVSCFTTNFGLVLLDGLLEINGFKRLKT